MSRNLQPRPRNRDIDLTVEAPTSGYEDMFALFRAKPSAFVCVRVGGEGADKARWRIRSVLRYHLGVADARKFEVLQTTDKRRLLVRRKVR